MTTMWIRRRAAGAGVLLALATSTPGVAAGPARSSGVVLLPLTFEQVMAAGAAGTGCSWSRSAGRGMLFAAADDRAVVRMRTGIVVLKPAADAGDLFPTTFDRWTGEGMTVEVRPRGRTTIRGESMVQPAILVVTVRGAARYLDGRLDCGS